MPSFARLTLLALTVAATALTGCASLHRAPANTPAMHGPLASLSAPAAANTGRVYLSGDISLVRFDALNQAHKNQNVQRWAIPEETPGRVVGRGEGWLAVEFAKDQYLYFTEVKNTLDGSRRSDARCVGYYYLYLPDWDGRAGSVKLGNDAWLAVGGSHGVYLKAEPASMNTPSLGSTSNDSSLLGRWFTEGK